ncbi:hypothetical protein [Agrobacterium radiobacter]|uniref:Uncharacterized protein n=1 Tax=Agrobacterium radiobacter TaxID=362 RepID=A0ABD5LKR1_AGRRD|nr:MULTISPECIES: hypothetical protein [Agrobacterium tumefaciens complex]KAB0462419.1 hypothetical protein F7R04_02230 [Agrobacterium tumefaciens]KWT80541.1 hypothetical protein ASH09_04645 [Agrobacterium radiobacter]NIB09232.1 hypothetical protein [Agrobacterium radiobacter]OOO38983.1 hypothetical protein BS628_02980 [Agrobacterium radiobacter]
MKYFFLAVAALTITACQQGPIVKPEPFDWRKAVNRNAERSCRDKKGTEQYAKCFDREVAKGTRESKMIAAHFGVKLQ